VRAHARTLRLRVQGEDCLREHLAGGGRVLFASWHQRFYAGVDYLRPYRPAIMISQSADGEMIARIVKAIGWTPVRGSSSRGGAIAMAGMIECLSKGKVGGHIVDGPRGPARTIKPGLIRIAQGARASIMPVYVAYARPWEAKSWDRFQVPLPFTRVLMRFGRLIEVPEELESEQLRRLCADLDVEFAREYENVDAEVGIGRKI
jgi:lysophospholipid acyltransferase (LPLAT)-like uncharacterized protein